MKEKLAPVSAMFAVLIALGVALGTPARADDVQNYLDALHSRGITAGHGDGTLVTAGEAICDYISQGHTPLEAAQQVYQKTDASINANDAGFIVGAAIANLC